MLLGLLAAAEETGDNRFMEAAARAGRWLADGVDPVGVEQPRLVQTKEGFHW